MIESPSRRRNAPLLLIATLSWAGIACGDDPPTDPPVNPDNIAPVAALEFPEAVGVGEVFVLDASGSQDEDGEIASFLFEIEGEPIIQTLSPELAYAFEAPGDFEVALTVIDDQGTKDTVRASIMITDDAP